MWFLTGRNVDGGESVQFSLFFQSVGSALSKGLTCEMIIYTVLLVIKRLKCWNKSKANPDLKCYFNLKKTKNMEKFDSLD